MTLKKRLVITIIVMLLVPALIILLFTAIMFAGMTLRERSLFFNSLKAMDVNSLYPDGALFGFLITWGGVSLGVMIASVAAGVVYISRKILIPMRELTKAAGRIRDGELDFEILSSNVAEAGELCDAFNDMRLRLKASIAGRLEDERRRNLMLADMSHDLRTPVTSIKGYVEGIRDGVAASPEMRERYLDTIYGKAASLERIIEQMSDFSELELGRMHFAFDRVSATEFFAPLFDEYATDFEASGARLDVSLDAALDGVTIFIDIDKLRRVFQNLLSNSLKYRSDERPLVVKAIVTVTSGAVHAVLADNGCGIKEGEINRVFEGFYRSDAARPTGGHGLGLAIARQIIQKHGGKIWLQSTENIGTEAHVTLAASRGEERG